MPNEKRNKLAEFISSYEPQFCDSARPYFETLDRVTNSRLATQAVGFFTGDDDSISTALWSAQSQVVGTLGGAATMETLPMEDPDIAFAKMASLPGLETCGEDFQRLHKAIEIWKAQGVKLRSKRSSLHIALFSQTRELAIEFTKHYHAYLTACGVVEDDETLVRARGGSLRSMSSLDIVQCGMCLIVGAKNLPDFAGKWLIPSMESNETVFVLSYVGEGESLHHSLDEDHFFMHLDTTTKKRRDPVEVVLKQTKSWMKKSYSREFTIEGGYDGNWVRMFAKRIVDQYCQDEKPDEKWLKRALAKQLELVVGRQQSRLLKSDVDALSSSATHLTRADLLADDPVSEIVDTEAWKKLHKMIGIAQVKESINSFANGVLLDHHRAMFGHKPARSGLSRLFVGPPGTGKTTVGKLYGEILCSLNLLSKGGFVYKKASDFIGAYIGHSAKQTRKILKEAQGQVLMIDEAYMLDPKRNGSARGDDPFRQEVLDTLVGEIQNTQADDICVILAGYQDLVESMITNSNPGLARRFPLADAFVFEDFDTRQLSQVLDLKLQEDNYAMTEEAKKVAMGALQLARQRGNFGNGGEIDNLLRRALKSYRTRFSNMSPDERWKSTGNICFIPEDIDPGWNQILTLRSELVTLLEGLAGLNKIKERLISLAQKAAAIRESGQDLAPFMPSRFVFEGASGTGKTTVAAIMAWLFHGMRMIPTEDVVHTSVRDLIASAQSNQQGSTGDSSSTCAKLFKEAQGKVLVIEEAHDLFGTENEVDNRMVRELREDLARTIKQDNFRGILILSGHETMLERTLNNNPALGSHFPACDRLRFSGLTGEACMMQLPLRLWEHSIGMEMSSAQHQQLQTTFNTLCRSSEWAHHRDIQSLARDLAGEVYGREHKNESIVTGDDVLRYLQSKYPRQLARQSAAGDETPATQAQGQRQPVEPSSERERGPQNDEHSVGFVVSELSTPPEVSGDPSNDERAVGFVIPQPPTPPEASCESSVHERAVDFGMVQLPTPPESSDDSSNHERAVDVGMLDPQMQPEVSYSSSETDFILLPSLTNVYEYRPLQDRVIRVLRLHPADKLSDPIECSIQFCYLDDESDQRLNYDALSYSWDGQEPTQSISCDGTALKVTRNAATALQHLRRRESPITLWIDGICINQESAAEKNQQVAMMGDIYKSAIHVYIWLGTGDKEGTQLTALNGFQKLCCLGGDWENHELIRRLLFLKYQEQTEKLVALEALIGNPWWQRMWTFQEFVLAKRPVFVVAHIQLPWDKFRELIHELMAFLKRKKGMTAKKWTKAKRSTAIGHFMPEDYEYAPEIEQGFRVFPSWLEVMDAMMCRAAYQEKMRVECRSIFMSHFLFKTRNRISTNPKDKVYGLFELFKDTGYQLPQAKYEKNVSEGDVYTKVTLALLQQSQSWWILSHLFNKRRQSDRSLPSWVPDFNSPAVWHQQVGLRFENMNEMEFALEREAKKAKERTADFPFYLKPTLRGLQVEAVFLWEVDKATFEMPPNPILDRSWEESFEQTEYSVLQTAMEDFLFAMANWLKQMEPTHSMTKPSLVDNMWSGLNSIGIGEDTTKQERQDLETDITRAIACAFLRGSWNILRSLNVRMEQIVKESDDPEVAEINAEANITKARMVFQILPLILANMRSCVYPDPEHPCRICGVTETHPGSEAVQHFMQWITSQEIEGLSYLRYALYSRAVDHALIQTKPTKGCRGHFGFCRNCPRVGDELVLLPGLADPVVVRKTGEDTYSIVGVTSGVDGPAIVTDNNTEMTGSFCFGTCPRWKGWSKKDVRTFYLV